MTTTALRTALRMTTMMVAESLAPDQQMKRVTVSFHPVGICWHHQDKVQCSAGPLALDFTGIVNVLRAWDRDEKLCGGEWRTTPEHLRPALTDLEWSRGRSHRGTARATRGPIKLGHAAPLDGYKWCFEHNVEILISPAPPVLLSGQPLV
ncbi:hypothetical protein BaRGS_00018587 [Batillaria attramentaria]|uniref:Uncharacterized protein n=1 Tax=Batillaria attramentaria TaxID=370345 RepID=A0ABD0KTX7_9CAEN